MNRYSPKPYRPKKLRSLKEQQEMKEKMARIRAMRKKK